MDLVAQAESLLLYQFDRSPKIRGLVKSLAKPFQEVLVHLEQLHHGRYINVDEAYGESLDIVGEIVDFSRNALSDEEYRVWLKVAILLNHCQGTADGVFAILKVLFGDEPKIQVDEYGSNVVMFTFFDYRLVPTSILFSIIRHALPISSVGIFVDASEAPPFQLDVASFDESIFADFFREDR